MFQPLTITELLQCKKIMPKVDVSLNLSQSLALT